MNATPTTNGATTTTNGATTTTNGATTTTNGDYAKKPGPYTRRYLAARIRKRQQSLFADGSDRRHFAVVTNRTGDGLALLRWHRLKAGTVAHAHDVTRTTP